MIYGQNDIGKSISRRHRETFLSPCLSWLNLRKFIQITCQSLTRASREVISEIGSNWSKRKTEEDYVDNKQIKMSPRRRGCRRKLSITTNLNSSHTKDVLFQLKTRDDSTKLSRERLPFSIWYQMPRQINSPENWVKYWMIIKTFSAWS